MSANAIAAIACFTIAGMWIAYAYALHWYSQRNEKRKPQRTFDDFDDYFYEETTDEEHLP